MSKNAQDAWDEPDEISTMAMTYPGRAAKQKQVACEQCPLRENAAFRPFTKKEFEFVKGFKSGELVAEAGTVIFLEGNNSAHLYTILSGWVFRYKMLEDGRRQILNFGLPGDFIGLQTSIFGTMDHSVEALTDVILCVFPREKMWNLFNNFPELAFDLTWLAAREEQMLDEALLSVGRRSAVERVSAVLLHLYYRIEQLGMTAGQRFDLPFTQQQLADAMGLSHVHTNKTIKKLTDRNLIEWRPPQLKILDLGRLSQLAQHDGTKLATRPLF